MPLKRSNNAFLKSGFNSKFIQLFSQNKHSHESFKDPIFNDVLLKRATAKKDADQKYYYFKLNGGSPHFHRILEEDPEFWLEILRACRETTLVRISEIHVAADCSRDLMKIITESIKKGHYESNGLNPYGFYRIENQRTEGPLEKFSSNYKRIKDQHFDLDTLYFGERRRQPVSLVFYNKEQEEMMRSNNLSSTKTRVKIRLNALT